MTSTRWWAWSTPPLYLDVDRGTSSLGDGTVDAFVLIPPEGFDSEYFTELYVKCADYPLYSDRVRQCDRPADRCGGVAVTGSVQTRFDDLVSDAEQEISDGEQELADKQAEAQTELDDAKAELDDAQTQLDDARGGTGARPGRAGPRQSPAGRRQSGVGRRCRADPKAASPRGMAPLEAGWAAYNDSKAQLEAAIAEDSSC